MKEEIKFQKYDTKGPGYHWDDISGSIRTRNPFVIARYNLVAHQLKDCNCLVLDVGCGDGALTYLLSKKGGRVIGIDSSDVAIRFATRKTRNNRVEFMKASVYHLPFADKCFDYVISSDVIEHLMNPRAMLEEMKRVFNGTGKIVVTTPLRCLEAPAHAMHVREFFESELFDLLKNTFDLSQIRIIKSHPLVYLELLRRFKLARFFFNALQIIFGINLFERTGKWMHYALLTAIITVDDHQ